MILTVSHTLSNWPVNIGEWQEVKLRNRFVSGASYLAICLVVNIIVLL